MPDSYEFSEFKDVFLQEAFEQLDAFDEGLLQLEASPGSAETLNDIFRCAHTLKGSSAMMGLDHIRDITHDAENVLDSLRNASEDARAGAVDPLLNVTRLVRLMVEQLASGSYDPGSLAEDLEQARARLTSCTATIGSAERPRTRARERTQPVVQGVEVVFSVTFEPDCLMPGVRAFMASQVIESYASILWSRPALENVETLDPGAVFVCSADLAPDIRPEQISAQIEAISEVVACQWQANEPHDAAASEPAVSDSRASAEPGSGGLQSVRVSVDILDRLVNLVGELVVDRTSTLLAEADLASRYPEDDLVAGVCASSGHSSQIISELHDEIMRLRMIPVGQMLRRFPRMMRDLSHSIGKSVELTISGEETGLDRSIIEDIVDPLTHILRNCIDHGIETPEEREAAGKPRTGSVCINAWHEEGSIVFEISDDGRGIDTRKLKQAAVDKGALSAEAASAMDDRSAMELLFQSGVSTASRVTDISGRGVGMDVVRANVEKLRGSVEVISEPGVGTTFRVRLPLTLAIVQALVVRCCGQLFAVPLSYVVSAGAFGDDSVHTVGRALWVMMRGEALPLIAPGKRGQLSGSHKPGSQLLCVIVMSGGQTAALSVDQLVGQMDVVVKPIGPYLGEIPGVSGAAVMGSGELALIVDIPGAVQGLASEGQGADKAA